MRWQINAFSGLTSTSPQIDFGNVELNLGSFLNDFLGPIVDRVNEVIDPVRPIIDVLTAPLPVISDLAGPTTLLDVADLFGYGEYNDFIYAAKDISDLALKLQNISVMHGFQWANLL